VLLECTVPPFSSPFSSPTRLIVPTPPSDIAIW